MRKQCHYACNIAIHCIYDDVQFFSWRTLWSTEPLRQNKAVSWEPNTPNSYYVFAFTCVWWSTSCRSRALISEVTGGGFSRIYKRRTQEVGCFPWYVYRRPVGTWRHSEFAQHQACWTVGSRKSGNDIILEKAYSAAPRMLFRWCLYRLELRLSQRM